MDFGELLIRWSVRLAMACYASVLLASACGGRPPATTQATRWIWTLGCGLFLLHVASAFHFYHHWSHAHAFADTAERTRAALGWQFGYGIYINHLFAVVWMSDVAWSWLSAPSYAIRPRWLVLAMHGFMLFIAINGLMVFKDGAVRWVSAVFALGITATWVAMRLARSPAISARDEAARTLSSSERAG